MRYLINLLFFISCLAANAQMVNAAPGNTTNRANVFLYNEREQYVELYAAKYKREFNSFNMFQLGLMRYFEERLARHGLPNALKSIAYLESALELEVTSHAGARGPWQLMPNTARSLGLVVNDRVDERTNVEASTNAALNHFRHLYRVYNDWRLAVAAYNCGEGNVNSAIRRSGGYRDIISLEPYLPDETKFYVRRFDAATIAWQNINNTGNIKAYSPTQQSVSTTSKVESNSAEDIEREKEIRLNKKGFASYKINAGYRLDVIAEILSVPKDKLLKLNDSFNDDMNKNGYTVLTLPKDKMTDFKLHDGKILNESLQRSALEFE